MWTYNYTNELYHHGVKGQKWGVRRYQNSDGTLTVAGRKHYSRTTVLDSDKYDYKNVGDIQIKKNSNLYRLTKSKEKADNYRKYVYTETDKDYYENVGFKNRIYKMTMTPVKELNIAGKKETVSAFLEIYNVKLSELNKNKLFKYDLDNTDDLANISYEIIQKFGSRSMDLMGNEKLTSDIIEKLSKKGYDGMVDVNDIYVYNGNGKNPLILFNPKDSIDITDISKR